MKCKGTTKLKDEWLCIHTLYVSGLVSTIDAFWDTPPGEKAVIVGFQLEIKALSDHTTYWNLFGMQCLSPDSTEELPLYVREPVQISVAPAPGKTWGTVRGNDDFKVEWSLIDSEGK